MDEAFGESVYRHYRLCLTKEAKAPEGRLFSVPYGDDYSDLAPFLLDLAPLKPLVTLPNPGYCFGRQREVEEVVTAPARARYEAVLPLYRQVGDVLGEANCIRSLGDIALRRSDDETARARYEEALPLYRQVGGVQGEANCIQSLGHIALRRSDHETARARYEEALPLYRQVGDVLGEANCTMSLGDIASAQGARDDAEAGYRQALALYERIADPYSIGSAHLRLAHVATDDAARASHVAAAREAWLSIGREDLVAEFLAELEEERK